MISRCRGMIRCRVSNLSIVRLSLVGNISNVSSIMISMVLNMLSTSIRQGYRVGTLNITVVIRCFSGIESCASVVIMYPILILIGCGILFIHRSSMIGWCMMNRGRVYYRSMNYRSMVGRGMV